MTQFDLRSEGRRYRNFIRRSRWLSAGCFGFAAVGAAYFGLLLALAGLTGASLTIGFGFALFMAVGFGWISWLFDPGADSVDVSESGITFSYSGGRSKNMEWTEPKFRLIIDQTLGHADPISNGEPLQAAADRRVFQNFLTIAAFQAIIEQARHHGLAITKGPSPRRGWIRFTIARAAG
jgi:hypothetical protein